MNPTIACVGPAGRPARALAGRVAERVAPERAEAFSLPGYLAAAEPPSRVVLCPRGASVAGDLEFLAQAAARLLWPAPTARFQQAIGGLRNTDGPSRPAGRRAGAARTPRGLLAALLLEGEVGPARARAALAASGPREWIVERPGRVRLSRIELERLARAGIRWSALEPVALVAVSATPALARARDRWRRLLPPATRLWVRDP